MCVKEMVCWEGVADICVSLCCACFVQVSRVFRFVDCVPIFHSCVVECEAMQWGGVQRSGVEWFGAFVRVQRLRKFRVFRRMVLRGCCRQLWFVVLCMFLASIVVHVSCKYPVFILVSSFSFSSWFGRNRVIHKSNRL